MLEFLNFRYGKKSLSKFFFSQKFSIFSILTKNFQLLYEKRKIILLSTRLMHQQSENGFYVAAVGVEREAPYFFTFLESPFRKMFFENRVTADKLAHVKGFRRHPFDFLRHRYYSQN